MPDPMLICPAVPHEAPLLSDLALRSKAYWGYDAAFLVACRADLALTPADISASTVVVTEVQGRIVGFYELGQDGDSAALNSLFVEPNAIGRGYGRQLLQHAMVTAQQRGYHDLLIASDPFAESFYRSMGAQRIGETPSTVIPGRMLPLLRLALHNVDHEVDMIQHPEQHR